MARYYDMDKLKTLIEAKADTLTQGKELLYHIAGWLNLLPAADVAPKSEVAKEIFAEIIEGLEEEKRREEQCRNSALESGDLVVAELYDYAADKLDTIITALNLCKKKYTEEKEL